MSVAQRAINAGHEMRVMAAVLGDAYARPVPRVSDGPLVTVVISAYNRAEVLGYALASALRQTYRRIEVLVIGDACSDWSEQVVREAGDERARWINLELNSGSQAGPHRLGLEVARGELIAYLGQDDVWRRDHLAVLVADLEHSGADVSSTVTSLVWPRPVPVRRLMSPAAGSVVPPSSVMHRRAAAIAAGGWRDYRETVLPPDSDLLTRLGRSGARFSRVRALTVLKFPTAVRPGSYRERKSDEQAVGARRIDRSGFVLREVAAAALLTPLRPWCGRHPRVKPGGPGAIVDQLRVIRGLD